jgi:FMN phosphatase YigB (HAD superfamily)
MTPATGIAGLGALRCIAFDYGGSLTTAGRPLIGGSRPVDPGCIAPLRLLAARYVLVLSSNTTPGVHRIPALAAAGIDHLFRAVLASACLGVAKPDPAFYAIIPAVAQCQPAQVLHVGNNIRTDVTGPARCGMHTALIRPCGLAPGEQDQLPPPTLVIRHPRELPHLLGCAPAANTTEGDHRDRD